MLRACRFNEARSKLIHQSLHHSPDTVECFADIGAEPQNHGGLSFRVLLNENGAGRFELTKRSLVRISPLVHSGKSRCPTDRAKAHPRPRIFMHRPYM